MKRRPPRHRGENGRYIAAADVTPGKRSVSVSRSMFARVKEFALDNDVAMTWIVEEAVAPVLADGQAASEMVPAAAVPMAARRPARRATLPEPPIPFWLLPTGPIGRSR